jgi:hypothetical protein
MVACAYYPNNMGSVNAVQAKLGTSVRLYTKKTKTTKGLGVWFKW